MPYSVVSKKSGATYHLHVRERTTSTGKQVPLYFFSKEAQGALEKLPDGYTVVEAPTGLPLLKRAAS